MFGKVIYFDSKKFNDYFAIATGNKIAEIEHMQVSNDKGVGLSSPILSAEIKGSKSYEANIKESLLFDIDNFEKKLEQREDFFDFILKDYDVTTINRGNIIKFNGFVNVPIEFDMTHMIGQFKPMLTQEITSEMPSSEAEAFKSFFNVCNPQIPIATQINDNVLISLIEADNLQIQYTELEEYETIEVTILARIVTSTSIDKSKAIFDPLKDFIRMNRATRREFMAERPDGLKAIFSKSNYRKIEIITIYQ